MVKMVFVVLKVIKDNAVLKEKRVFVVLKVTKEM
jgi:hypothetical protein